MKSRFTALKKNRDFGLVYREGKAFANRLFVIIVRQSAGSGPSRIGISVSKKIGNSVTRHRVKRQVRECFRTHWEQWKAGCDIVVIARQEVKESSFQKIENALWALMKKHGLVSEP